MKTIGLLSAGLVLILGLGCDDGGGGTDAGPPAVDAGGGSDAGGGEDAGPPVVPSWDCLGSVTLPTPGATSTLDLTLQDFLRRDPVEGAMVEACLQTDTACATPLVSGTTDAMGHVALEVDTSGGGVLAYVRVQHASYPTARYYASIPFSEDRTFVWWLINESGIGTVALGVGEDQDLTTNALLASLISDCDGQQVPGVQFSLSPDVGAQFYVDGTLPDPAATATDETGGFGVLNLPPGDYTLSAQNAAGTTIGASAFTAIAGEAVIVFLLPTPDGGLVTP